MNSTLIVETTAHGIFVECRSCGSSNYSDKAIMHRSRCQTKSAQYDETQVYVGEAAAKAELSRPVAKSDDSIKAHAANVKRTGLTLGRDEETIEAVRRGYLSMSDAMNTDD